MLCLMAVGHSQPCLGFLGHFCDSSIVYGLLAELREGHRNDLGTLNMQGIMVDQASEGTSQVSLIQNIWKYLSICYSSCTILTYNNRLTITDSKILPVLIIFCIRDSSREYKSNYELLRCMKISMYNLIIGTESGIFFTMFWSSYQHSITTNYIISNLSLNVLWICSNDLSSINTNLLSNRSICLTYHLLEQCSFRLMLCYVVSWLFVSGQLTEFSNMSIYVNDGISSSVFYSVDGCHLYHLIVGNILLALVLCVHSCCK
jgi:heme/copper-type cytochrome/quinol oxidase subunit 3